MTVHERNELDVREIPKQRRHPSIFARFAELELGESFILVNNHDPKPLRAEFERDQPGTFGWDYVESGPRDWRIRISRVGAVPHPQVLCDVAELLASEVAEDPNRAVWALPVAARQLDANVIRLGAGNRIEAHSGPDLDVLMLVVGGSGSVITDNDVLPVADGALVWLPQRSRRAMQAGDQGMAYLTVHRRRPALQISTAQNS